MDAGKNRLPPSTNSLNLSQKPGRVSPQQLTDLQELDDIQTPVTVLDLRHEGLGPAKFVCHLLLGQICILPSPDQGFKESAVSPFVN